MNTLSASTSKYVFAVVLSIIFPLISCLDVYADVTPRQWLRIGPDGGDIKHFIVSASHPDTIYASTHTTINNAGRIYQKSINGGASWSTLPYQQKLDNLAIDAVNPLILFASNNSGILKSTDGGIYWRQIGLGLELDGSAFFLLNTPITHKLRTHTQTDESAEARLAISEDGGENWRITNAQISTAVENKQIRIEASDSRNAEILYSAYYECCGGFGVPLPPYPAILYKSVDHGLNWVDITIPGYQYNGGLIIDPVASNKLYSFFSSSQFSNQKMTMVSNNRGQNWEALSIPIENKAKLQITRLFVDPTHTNILYATLSSLSGAYEQRKIYEKRIAISKNAGQKWQVIDTTPFVPNEIVIDRRNNQKLLMATDRGVLSSENGGQDWRPSSIGIRFIGGSLSVAADNETVMYLVSNHPGLYFKSFDAGQHWESFAVNGDADRPCLHFILNPRNNREIICQTEYDLYRSQDAGKQWELIRSHFASSTAHRFLKVVYANDGKTLYSVTYELGLSKSLDNGDTWDDINSGISDWQPSFLVDPRDQKILYSSVYNGNLGVFKSFDGGRYWHSQVIAAWPAGHNKLIMHPLNPNRLVFTSSAGGGVEFLLSKDAGNSWETILEPFPEEYTQIRDIVFKPDDLDGLFVATEQGIFETLDLGMTWRRMNSGLDSLSERSSGPNIRLQTYAKNIYVEAYSGIFKLSHKKDFSGISDCLFQWAEHHYPQFFSPVAVTQQWGGYDYRHYSNTNTFLGIFMQQEIHLLQPRESNKIDFVGLVEPYKKITHCDG